MPCCFCFLTCKMMSPNRCFCFITLSKFSFLKMCCSICVIIYTSFGKWNTFFPYILFGWWYIWLFITISMKCLFISPIGKSMITGTFRTIISLPIINYSCNSLSTTFRLTSGFIKNCSSNLNVIISLHCVWNYYILVKLN